MVAAQAVERHALELQRASQAVRLSTAVVDTEKKKFQLGMATLFDALLAEDTLSTALLQQIDARSRYVQALARLRFETADLLTWSPAGPSVRVDGLLATAGGQGE
jgi:outer membrane protein TolC